MSFVIRMELAQPDIHLLVGNYQVYNVLPTAHAFLVTFFMVLPVMLERCAHCSAVGRGEGVAKDEVGVIAIYRSITLPILVVNGPSSALHGVLIKNKFESSIHVLFSRTITVCFQPHDPHLMPSASSAYRVKTTRCKRKLVHSRSHESNGNMREQNTTRVKTLGSASEMSQDTMRQRVMDPRMNQKGRGDDTACPARCTPYTVKCRTVYALAQCFALA